MKFVGKSLIIIILAAAAIAVFAVSVSNAEFGEDNPPVIATVDTLLFENFNGPEGPFANNPLPEWTVIDSGVPEWDETSWSRYYNSPYPQYWNGDLARVMFSGTGAIGDWLITPTLDCSVDDDYYFSYKQSHSNRSSSDNDTIFVYGSTDNGANWSETIFMATQTVGALNHPDTQIVDITSWAAGEPNVRIAFYFKGNDVLTWYIDEPTVVGDSVGVIFYEDFNGIWGEFGNNPPAGWTIINEIIPDPPNNNDWSRWFYSTWPDTVALAYDFQNDQTANEWLITPSLSFSPEAICSLSYYNSYWDDSFDETDSAFVLGSTDGGQTWDHTVATYGGVDDRSTNRGNSWRGFDISDWAQGQSDVKFAFRYIKDDPSYLGWWFFDDLTITETAVGADNVAALSIDNPSEFVVVGEWYYPHVTVQSLSLVQQTIDLNLVVDHGGEVYNQTEENIVIEPGEIDQITFHMPFVPSYVGDHLFTATVINPGDEDPADDTVRVTLPAYAHIGMDCSDDFGYCFIDNTEDAGPDYNWIEISQTGTQIEPGMHYFMSDAIPLGFDFNYYGQDYSTIYVNSHGELHLGARDTWLSTNDCPLPDPSTPHAPLMAVFWDLLYIHYEQGQGVYYQQFDQPENHFVVQWQAKVDNQHSDSLVFEAILYESGDFVYQYKYVNDLTGGQGQAATIGIEYDPISSGMSYNCDDGNPANRLQNGLAIRWSTEITGVTDGSLEMPEKFALRQNYPNPFNAETSISYELPNLGHVRIEVYDILGRLVATLVDSDEAAGRHSVVWDASRQSSGVYLYKITAGDYSDIKKMTLLK